MSAADYNLVEGRAAYLSRVTGHPTARVFLLLRQSSELGPELIPHSGTSLATLQSTDSQCIPAQN
jgi:hypothetical protein